MTKLKAAKKQAASLVENSELSQSQKLKAIQKAMRGASKAGANAAKPSKVYVVTRKTGAGSVGTSLGGAKGGKLKFVDKRMKKEVRAARRREKGKKKRR